MLSMTTGGSLAETPNACDEATAPAHTATWQSGILAGGADRLLSSTEQQNTHLAKG